MSDLARQVTAAEAARILGINASRIHRWKQRKLINPVAFKAGAGRGGVVPEYDLEQLRELLAKMG